MRNSAIIFAFLAVTIVTVLRELGLWSISAYTCELKSITREWDPTPLLKFNNIGQVEIVDDDLNKVIQIGESNNKLRLKVIDVNENYTASRWIPLYKSGKSIIRAYISIESGQGDGKYNKWASVIPVTINCDMSIRGICSAYDYRRIVYSHITAFKKSDFDRIR